MSVTEFSKSGIGASFTQTSAIPVTTVFTPPDDCTAASAYAKTYWAGNQWAYQLDWGINTPSCYPTTGYSEYQYDSRLWYSPGACPYSYEYVATSVQHRDSDPAITLAVCCPPGVHTGPGGSDWSCVQVLTTSVTDLSFSNSHSSAPAGTTAFANPISVAWQESDLDNFAPASAPLLALARAGVTFPPDSSTPTPSASTSDVSSTLTPSTTTSATSTNSPGANSGLSTGAAAGIGVGATLGGTALLAGVWWFARNFKLARRERQRDRGTELPSHQIGEGPRYQKDSNTTWFTNRAEVPEMARPHELEGSARAELEGGWKMPEAGRGVRSPI